MIDERLITEFSYKTLIRKIGDYQHEGFWGSFKNAKRELVAPLLALSFKLGYPDVQIVQLMPFFQRVAARPHLIDAHRTKDPILSIEYHTKDWFDDTPYHARLFLRTHSLNEYLDLYLSRD